MKVILAPDSFKGTLTARQVCEILSEAVLSVNSETEIIKLPIADGGEGTIDAFNAEHKNVTVTGPHFQPVKSYWGIINSDTAVIETAVCAGLSLAAEKDPEKTTTYGMGELIKAALDEGIRKFIIALGGSATNDGGCGMAAALGVRFYGDDRKAFIPVGGTLKDIVSIDVSELDERLKESAVSVMCDVENTLYGENGAAYVYAPQKGADEKAVGRLDFGLRHLSKIIESDLKIDVSQLRGGGAAGGMGAGASVFLTGMLHPGIEIVLDAVDFDGLLDGTDLVISGEGRFDSQSLQGKAISGISRRTKKKNIPLVVIAGAVDDSAVIENESGITAVFSIQRTPLPFELSQLRTRADLFNTTKNIISLIIC